MLPFTCGARSLRHIRSTFKISGKLRKTVARVNYAKTISALGVANRQCSNNTIHEVLNKNELKPFSTPAYNISATCSSIALLLSDGGASSLALSVGVGDDDEVTTSAGKKRKHWLLHAMKG